MEIDGALVNVENVDADSVVIQESDDEHREYLVTYSLLPKHILKEEPQSEDSQNESNSNEQVISRSQCVWYGLILYYE